MQRSVEIAPANSAHDLAAVRELFREYADSLGFDLGFQDFERELAELPGDYAAPSGALLLAWVEGEAAACVALRDLGGGISEMKRLYVRPAFRGLGLGRRLAEAVIEVARGAGYASMRLDTVPRMREARRLYRSLGFHAIPPYRFNPIDGTEYLERTL
jgi:putative acetyltransferase